MWALSATTGRPTNGTTDRVSIFSKIIFSGSDGSTWKFQTMTFPSPKLLQVAALSHDQHALSSAAKNMAAVFSTKQTKQQNASKN
jgi:hypothetical protein